MKINETLRPGRELQPSTKERTPLDPSSFGNMLKDKSKQLGAEQLGRLLTEIGHQGERLARHHTVEELRTFKSLVRRFVHEAVAHGLVLEEKSGHHPFGRDRKLKVIKEVDRQLLQLTDEVLDAQKKSVDLLARIGEIHGLLLNLYV
jgi:uncharacterized protein YaaR (DUF327 family)